MCVVVLADCPVCCASVRAGGLELNQHELMKDAAHVDGAGILAAYLTARFVLVNDPRLTALPGRELMQAAQSATNHKLANGGLGMFFPLFPQLVFIEFFCFLCMETDDCGNSGKERLKENSLFLHRDSRLTVLAISSFWICFFFFSFFLLYKVT